MQPTVNSTREDESNNPFLTVPPAANEEEVFEEYEPEPLLSLNNTHNSFVAAKFGIPLKVPPSK